MGIVMQDLKLTKESRPIGPLGGYIDSIVKSNHWYHSKTKTEPSRQHGTSIANMCTSYLQLDHLYLPHKFDDRYLVMSTMYMVDDTLDDHPSTALFLSR
jgi:hypothetical protein